MKRFLSACILSLCLSSCTVVMHLQHGNPVYRLEHLKPSSSSTEKQAARNAITGHGVKSIPSIIQAFPNLNWTAKAVALDALNEVAERDPEAILKIISYMNMPDVKSREASVSIAGGLHSAEPKLIPALTGALGDVNPAVRSAAVLALLGYKKLPQRTITALGVIVSDPDASTRAMATAALCIHGGANSASKIAASIPKLIKGLGTNNHELRGTLIFALGQCGWRSEEATYRLTKLLNSEKNEIRKLQIAIAILRIGSNTGRSATLPVIKKLIKSNDPAVRSAAFGALQLAEKSS